jgi:hypothetical protein
MRSPFSKSCRHVTIFSAIKERKVIVKYLGNDHASHKAWMKKNLFELLALNKMSKTKKLVEAKLYDVRLFKLYIFFNLYIQSNPS